MSIPFTLNFPTALDDADSLGIASNDAAGILAAPGLAIGAPSFELTLLADANEFGASGPVTIGNEVIYYERAGVVFTVLARGCEGTTEVAHNESAAVEQNFNAAYHNILSAAIIALQTNLQKKPAYVLVTAASYARAAGVGFIEVDGTAGSQTITLGTPDGMPVKVRKVGSDFNDAVFNYGSLLTLNVPGQYAEFVPNAAGTGWVLWSQVI
jgi:hypothetical protein